MYYYFLTVATRKFKVAFVAHSVVLGGGTAPDSALLSPHSCPPALTELLPAPRAFQITLGLICFPSPELLFLSFPARLDVIPTSLFRAKLSSAT